MEAGALTPSASDAELRQLGGQSALSGGGWSRFWRLLWQMTKSDFKLRYSQPLLGYVWSLLGPLLFAGVLYVAFTRFLRFGGEIENYPLLLIFNLMMFQLFLQGSAAAVRSFVTKQNLTRKVEFPLLVVPLASVGANFVTFCLNMVVVFALMVITGIEIRWTWLLFPVIALWWVTATSIFAVLLASVYLRFRDLSEIWTASARALMYMSPVLYPVEFFPSQWHFLLQLNPLAPILAEARVWILDPSAPTYTGFLGGPEYLLAPLGILVVGAAAATFAFRRVAQRAPEL